MRHLLGTGGRSGDASRPDTIVYLAPGETPNGFKHPDRGSGDNPATLSAVQA